MITRILLSCPSSYPLVQNYTNDGINHKKDWWHRTLQTHFSNFLNWKTRSFHIKIIFIRTKNYQSVTYNLFLGKKVLMVGISGPKSPCEEVLIKHLGDKNYNVTYSICHILCQTVVITYQWSNGEMSIFLVHHST